MSSAAANPDPNSTPESTSGTRWVDSHVHVIDPARFPYREGVGYHPGPHEIGPVDALLRTLDAHRVSRALLVQPSCYDTDNRALLDALRRAPARFRGIAQVPDQPDDDSLAELSDAGVVGVRFNFQHSKSEQLQTDSIRRTLRAIAPLGWFAEVNTNSDAWAGLAPALTDTGVPILVDHFGGAHADRGVDQPGFQAICRLGRETQAVVKISAPFRLSGQESPYPDLRPLAEALLDAYGPERVVWGSDWPFINLPAMIDYPNPAELLAAWGADEALTTRILATNPAGLFGFPADEASSEPTL